MGKAGIRRRTQETLQIDGINKMEWHLSDEQKYTYTCKVTHSYNMNQLHRLGQQMADWLDSPM